MSIPTVITMVLILGIVWGGLAFFLAKAFRFEKSKSDNGEE